MPHYLTQVVPAPPGWSTVGEATPDTTGFWYESDYAVLYPHPDNGWVMIWPYLTGLGSEATSFHSTPQAAFAAYSLSGY